MTPGSYVVEVIVENKPLARDPEGETIHQNLILKGGYKQVTGVRAGKLLRMNVAANSPSLRIVKEAAEGGKPVLGICNGFQILVEAGLLPGAVLRNSTLRFVCTWTRLRVETTRTPFTIGAEKGQMLEIPIAHNEGRYYLDKDQIPELERNQQIVFRYVNEKKEATEDANPNGSVDNIAGICNQKGNVIGLMPHPERASLPVLSLDNQTDGRVIFDSMMRALHGPGA